MKEITIDYEGHTITQTAESDATHVVVSHKSDGGLRIQPTADPVHAMVRAQRAGDKGNRMTSLEDGHATFTAVPDYDGDADVDRAAKRSQVSQALVVAALLVAVLVVAVWL